MARDAAGQRRTAAADHRRSPPLAATAGIGLDNALRDRVGGAIRTGAPPRHAPGGLPRRGAVDAAELLGRFRPTGNRTGHK